MSAMPALEQFLLTTTGLPRWQILELYNTGFPWPLWTAHEVKQAGLLAQANGLPFPHVLAKVEAANDATQNVMFSAIEADPRLQALPLSQKLETLTAVPWLKEMRDHLEGVRDRTQAPLRSVFLLSLALQRYAILHPGWELLHMRIGQRPC